MPLVEKPVTAALDEGRRLVDEAAAAGVPVLVGHHRRYHPRIKRLWKLVKGGAIGSLIGVSLLWAVKKPDAYYDIVWRTRTGGGPVLTNLIHEIDTLRYICGEITQCLCRHQLGDTRLRGGGHRRDNAEFRGRCGRLDLSFRRDTFALVL